MKKFLGLLVLSAPLLAQEDDWNLNHRFAITGDYLHYRRTLSHKEKFVYNVPSGSLSTCSVCKSQRPCTTGDLVRNFEFKMGYRVAASLTTHRSMWEASYMRIEDWEGTCGATASGSLDLSVKNASLFYDYTGANNAQVTYKTGFEGAEFNYWRFVSWKKDDYVSASWLLGLRYFQIPERVHVAYETSSDLSTIDIDAKNYIGTLQGGVSLQWNPMTYLSWDLVLKGGGGYGWAHVQNRMGDYNNTVTLFSYDAWGNSWPFFVDVGLTLGWQALNWLNFHAAYQMIYLNGFTAAPDQLSKKPTPHTQINPIGAAIFYGLSGGLTISF